jgi:hypothetical protein
MKSAPRLLVAAFMAFAPFVLAEAAFADDKACPPGLAKKDPPCVPPGLAKKGVTTDEWLDHDRTGEVIDRDDLIFLDDYWRYGLPRLPVGQRYAVIDGRIVVIDPQSYQILQLIEIFRELAD